METMSAGGRSSSSSGRGGCRSTRSDCARGACGCSPGPVNRSPRFGGIEPVTKLARRSLWIGGAGDRPEHDDATGAGGDHVVEVRAIEAADRKERKLARVGGGVAHEPDPDGGAAGLCLLSIALAGWLFWKLVSVMARIQAPHEPPPP